MALIQWIFLSFAVTDYLFVELQCHLVRQMTAGKIGGKIAVKVAVGVQPDYTEDELNRRRGR